MHIQFDEHDAMPIAKLILKTAIDNFPNRKRSHIPDQQAELIAGFSHEYITYMLGGLYRASFRPLNDAIIEGRIKGAVGIVGCNNPRTPHDLSFYEMTKEFISQDILVVQTGCGAITNAKFGLLTPDAIEFAGPGLREVCEAVGIPPVLHLGSCVDNTRILTVLTQNVLEGGLGDDISDLPVAGMAPEWMSEKALSIGAYFVASGVQTYFGVDSPVSGCEPVAKMLSEGWAEKFGAGLIFEPDYSKTVAMVVDHIMGKRRALKLGSWAPGKYSRTYITPQAAAQGLVAPTAQS
jgi:carbon-monoxide dehydrogenase catalytic subunit